MYATEVKNNYKAKLLLHELFDKKDSQNLLWQEPCKGAKTDSRENFGKEIVARVGTHKRPKWVPYYGGQADSGRGQDGSGSAQACSGLLRLCSGLLRIAQAMLRLVQALLRHTHPRLRRAHPQLRLKQQLLTSAD
jgi:hypothetical protein